MTTIDSSGMELLLCSLVAIGASVPCHRSLHKHCR
jgi:hypothetical protein